MIEEEGFRGWRMTFIDLVLLALIGATVWGDSAWWQSISQTTKIAALAVIVARCFIPE